MDPDRARKLLEEQRQRLEHALAGRAPELSDELSPTDSADLGSDVLIAEIDEGLASDLREELAAIERAEARLAAGTYGRSIESGLPIADERLEVNPSAERTAEEQARYEGRPGPA